jgi:ferredoxin-NADP reductase
VACPVLSVIAETTDIRTFRIARPEGFAFKAGQFVAVRVRADGKEHVRCYSISSAPGAQGHLEISVKRAGLVSGTLHATLRPGSTMFVKAPAGAFVYPGGTDRPLVFMAGGVGITPLMSMLRHAVDAEPNRPVTLFYSVKSEADVAFRDELQLLSRRHAQVRVFIAVTGGGATGEYFPGRINESLVAATIPDIADASCLVCGPQPMIDAMTGLLIALGVPRPQIQFEVFQAAVAAASGLPREARPATSASGRPAGHETTFQRSGLVAQVGGSQTLLEGAESCGAPIASLCRSGVCGTCRTRVLSGDVDCASHMLDDQDRRDGYVLACVSRLRSNCAVDA